MLFNFDSLTGDGLKKKILVLFVLIGLKSQAIFCQEDTPSVQPTDCVSIDLDCIPPMETIEITIDEINEIAKHEAENMSLATKLKIAGSLLQLHIAHNKKPYLIASGITASIILAILAYNYLPKSESRK